MSWDAIESWLRAHRVEGVARLNPGASDEALASFARELEVELPLRSSPRVR